MAVEEAFLFVFIKLSCTCTLYSDGGYISPVQESIVQLLGILISHIPLNAITEFNLTKHLKHMLTSDVWQVQNAGITS